MNRLLWSCAAVSLLAVSAIAGCAHHRQSAEGCGDGCCGGCGAGASNSYQSYSAPANTGGSGSQGMNNAPIMNAPAGSSSGSGSR